MSTSDNINEIAAALSKAQGEIKNPKKDKTAKVQTKTGKDYEYSYSDLASLRDAVTPALSKHGIAVVQFTEVIAAGIILHTRLAHSSGQWIESTYPIEATTDRPQAIGSALSFGRRYCLASICGVASEDDDDGAVAQDHGRANGTWSAKAEANAAAGDKFVYERLVNTMRSTKTLEALAEWKTRNQAETNALPQEWYDRLTSIYGEHRARLPWEEKKPKAGTLSERALEANRPVLPDDEVRFE